MKIDFPEAIDAFPLPLPLDQKNSQDDGMQCSFGDVLYALRQVEKKVGIDGPWAFLEEGGAGPAGAERWIEASHEYRITQIETDFHLDDLVDVTLTPPMTGETLRYSENGWRNSFLRISDLTDADGHRSVQMSNYTLTLLGSKPIVLQNTGGSLEFDLKASTGQYAFLRMFSGTDYWDTAHVGSDYRIYHTSTAIVALTTGGTLNLPSGPAITGSPPGTSANVKGWKIGLYSTTMAIGVATNTVYIKTPSMFSIGANDPADSGSPDSNATFSISGATGAWYANGKCLTYNSVTTEGWGLAPIVDYFNYIGTTSQTPTLSNTTATGLYRICISVEQVTSGGNTATVAIQYTFRDPGGTSRTITLETVTLTPGMNKNYVVIVYHTGAATNSMTLTFTYTANGSTDSFYAGATTERLA